MKKKKISVLQFILTAISVVSLLISNIIVVKEIQLPFGIVVTGPLFIFPITYILSDLFSEVYGYKWSRFTCYMGFIMNLFMVITFQLAIWAPAPEGFESQEALEIVLGSTPLILFASVSAYLLGDLANDIVFALMKKRHPDSEKGFGARAILSSMAGSLIDAMVFYPIVFIGRMPFHDILIIFGSEFIIKNTFEFLVLPLTRFLVRKAKRYEGDEQW